MNILRNVSRFVIPYKPRCRLCINTRNIVIFYTCHQIFILNYNDAAIFRENEKRHDMTKQGMNDQFEALMRTNPEFACQLQHMTRERIYDVRVNTFGRTSGSAVGDTEMFQFALDYFSGIANGQAVPDIIRELGVFARERGVTFDEGWIAKDIEQTRGYFISDGFKKKLDDASRQVNSSKECLLM